MNTTREAFEKIIANDPRDFTTRKVFADWLEQFGIDEDDLADMHRRWDDETQDAYERLGELAALYEVNYQPLPVSDLIKAMHKHCDSGESSLYLSDDTPAEFYQNREQIWKDFAKVTGRSIDEDDVGFGFVRCSC